MPIVYPATIVQFKAQFDRDFPFGLGRDAVRDSDILNAQGAAAMMFNAALWDPVKEAPYAFNLATAHFVALSLQAAGGLTAAPNGVSAQGPQSRGGGVVQSKGVGSVNVQYALPEFVTKSKVLSQLMRTDYGQQYLALAAPRLVGNVGASLGPMDPDVAVPNIPFV